MVRYGKIFELPFVCVECDDGAVLKSLQLTLLFPAIVIIFVIDDYLNLRTGTFEN